MNSYFDGEVYRWLSNNDVVPLDACKEYGIDKLAGFNAVVQEAARIKETAEFLEEYRKNRKSPSAEELYEMKAAFGDTTVVNIITGEKICL